MLDEGNAVLEAVELVKRAKIGTSLYRECIELLELYDLPRIPLISKREEFRKIRKFYFSTTGHLLSEIILNK